ncbi:MAG: hypothetical protein LBT32_02415 [Peptococcaceae bacterium]|nr:hypothetical protein [Peptococcaceae bacterium]
MDGVTVDGCPGGDGYGVGDGVVADNDGSLGIGYFGVDEGGGGEAVSAAQGFDFDVGKDSAELLDEAVAERADGEDFGCS